MDYSRAPDGTDGKTSSPLKLMCILAHPDDESMGTGGILARYAAEGVETHLVTATRGERGWQGPPEQNPGPGALGRLREGELRAAARVLGLRTLEFLDYIDGELDRADPVEATAKLVAHVRRVRPQVVVTFGPEGAYGHPDHIAMSQLTAAAILAAADPDFASDHRMPAHRVAKLYFLALTRPLVAAFLSVVGDMVIAVDGVQRCPVPWEDWAITTRVDAEAYWQIAWQAVACHRSQLAGLDIRRILDDVHRRLWGQPTFYRALSLVNGGRQIEHDLFEGLRQPDRIPSPARVHGIMA